MEGAVIGRGLMRLVRPKKNVRKSLSEYGPHAKLGGSKNSLEWLTDRTATACKL